MANSTNRSQWESLSACLRRQDDDERDEGARFRQHNIRTSVRRPGRFAVFFLSALGIGCLLFLGCRPSMKEGPESSRPGAFDIDFDKTTVSELFTRNQILYHLDVKRRVLYANEKDYDAVARRLKVKRIEGRTWELDFGPLKGQFTVMSSNQVDKALTVEEHSASGLNGYECGDIGAGICIESVGEDKSFKLVTADTICLTPPSTTCDVVWRNVQVDEYSGKTCQGNPTRIQRNTALCVKP